MDCVLKNDKPDDTNGTTDGKKDTKTKEVEVAIPDSDNVAVATVKPDDDAEAQKEGIGGGFHEVKMWVKRSKYVCFVTLPFFESLCSFLHIFGLFLGPCSEF